jgi:hypothetical protein
MSKQHKIVLDHTPSDLKCDTFGEWLDYTLIGAEEVGRENKYFDQDTPYWETYNRQLTPRQRVIRRTMKGI